MNRLTHKKFIKQTTIKEIDIFKGKVRSILVPRERALDIDDEYDLKLAKLFLKK